MIAVKHQWGIRVKPKVSVIIPVYNAMPYIQRCISSIIKQNYPHLEIILINDGSDDGSERFCRDISINENNIITIQTDHVGVSVARNIGLEQATGEFILFCDADDYICENAINLMVDVATKNDADAVCGITRRDKGDKYDTYGQTIEDERKVETKDIINSLNTNSFITPTVWAKLIRKTSIGTIRFDERVRVCEDYDFIYHVLSKAYKVFVIPSYVYSYTDNPNSSTNRGFKDGDNAIVDKLELIFDEIKKTYPSCRKTALVKTTIEEMAVVTSMVKSEHFEWTLINTIRITIRERLSEIVFLNYGAVEKIATIVFVINPKLFLACYRKMRKWRQS